MNNLYWHWQSYLSVWKRTILEFLVHIFKKYELRKMIQCFTAEKKRVRKSHACVFLKAIFCVIRCLIKKFVLSSIHMFTLGFGSPLKKLGEV
jgi:hypothetical protein